MPDVAVADRVDLRALTTLGTIGPGDDLAALVCAAAEREGLELRDGDVLVFAQKVVSKAEGRRVPLAGVEPSPRAHDLAARTGKDPRVVELVLRESRTVLRATPGVIVVEDRRGLVMANAGIDASNVEAVPGEEAVLLLPEDPDASADRLAGALAARTGARIGVVVNDSFGRAWRLGTVGTAIGVAGLPALLDLRGRPDRGGRALQTTEVGFADEVAAAASLLMGQADEGRPVVLVRGVRARAPGRARDLLRPAAKDLFR